MDLSKLTPSDAIVALRGFERRYRGLFAGLGEDGSPDDMAQRVAGGWSALAHVVAAAWAIGDAERALAAVLTSDVPTLRPDDVDIAARPKPGRPTGSVHERLAELGLEATNLADRIDRVPASDWVRQAVVGDGSGRRVTALDIVRLAVDAGVEHLRGAAAVLDAVRGQPREPR